jgi:GH25 family lysozyme M1 (1,4-beta-N-acetylmuramidase)
MATKMKGIDVSSWQGNIDFKKVKAAGIKFVVIRAGYGNSVSQKDSKFEQNYKNAKAAGLKVGAYWYSYASTKAEAIKEATVCLSCIKGKSFDLPIYFDIEDASVSNCSKETLTACTKAFCDTIAGAKYKAGVYANLSWFNSKLDYASLKKKYSIWLAQWSSKNQLACDLWQNSETGKVNGIGGNVDTDYAFVDFSTKKTTPKKKITKFKNKGSLYAKAYKDLVGGASKPKVTLQKGSQVEWISDDKFGWSKVKYAGKTYYTLNANLGKTGLSKRKKVTLTKDCSAFKVTKDNKRGSTVTIKKGKKVDVICVIEDGKYKNWTYAKIKDVKYYVHSKLI